MSPEAPMIIASLFIAGAGVGELVRDVVVVENDWVAERVGEVNIGAMART